VDRREGERSSGWEEKVREGRAEGKSGGGEEWIAGNWRGAKGKRGAGGEEKGRGFHVERGILEGINIRV